MIAPPLVRIANTLDVPVMTLLKGVPGASRQHFDASPVALIAKAQPLRLVTAFAAIGDQSLRHALLALAEGIARSSSPSPGGGGSASTEGASRGGVSLRASSFTPPQRSLRSRRPSPSKGG